LNPCSHTSHGEWWPARIAGHVSSAVVAAPSGSGIATMLATFPGVRLPTSAPTPKASAPHSVPMRKMSCGSISECARATNLISASKSKSGFDARLSVPSATRMPAASSFASGYGEC
jgi:hypothetical protein